jgi:hypothetical protein
MVISAIDGAITAGRDENGKKISEEMPLTSRKTPENVTEKRR